MRSFTCNAPQRVKILGLLLWLIVGTAYAQKEAATRLPADLLERLRKERPVRIDRRGISVPSPEGVAGKYVPNEIIVHFKTGTLRLPIQQAQTSIEQIRAPQSVMRQLRNMGVQQIRKVFPAFTPADTLQLLVTGEQIQVADLSQTFVLTFPAPVDVPALISRLETLPEVIYAEPNHIYQLAYQLSGTSAPVPLSNPQPLPPRTPADPYFTSQWALKPPPGINAEQAWDIQTGSWNVRIGIIDSGIDYTHPDLGGSFGVKVTGGYDYGYGDADPLDDYWHGTHVAGIAAAFTHNLNSGGQREGIAGVAGGWGYDARNGSGNKGAQLIALKISGPTGITTENAAQAIVSCASPNQYNCHVLNNSWGGYQYDETIRGAINYAARLRRVFVAAKGNDNTTQRHYPSDYDQDWVISVGATNKSGGRASPGDPGWPWPYYGSNYGNGIDVMAPGTAILSTMPTYRTADMIASGLPPNYAGAGNPETGPPISGTSMAAPHVSGVAALLLSENSTLHPQEIEGIIQASARDIQTPGYDEETGYGIVDARRALEMLRPPWELDRYTARGGTIVSSTGVYPIIIFNTGGGLPSGIYFVRRHEVRTTVQFPKTYQEKPYVFGRGPGITIGWGPEAPNYQTGFVQVVTSSYTSATLRTYIYQVWDEAGYYKGWFPTTASNVVFAYSVLGKPEAPPPPPAPPTNLTVTTGPVSSHPQLNWTASSGATGYYIYRCSNLYYTCSSFSRIASTTATSYIDQSKYIGSGCLGGGDEITHYYVTAYNTGGESDPSNTATTCTDAPGKTNAPPVPRAFALHTNTPNPFQEQTELRFDLPEATRVRVVIYDVLGREVARLVDGEMSAGYHRIVWNATHLPSGVYVCRFEAGTFQATRHMLLLR